MFPGGFTISVKRWYVAHVTPFCYDLSYFQTVVTRALAANATRNSGIPIPEYITFFHDAFSEYELTEAQLFQEMSLPWHMIPPTPHVTPGRLEFQWWNNEEQLPANYVTRSLMYFAQVAHRFLTLVSAVFHNKCLNYYCLRLATPWRRSAAPVIVSWS